MDEGEEDSRCEGLGLQGQRCRESMGLVECGRKHCG